MSTVPSTRAEQIARLNDAHRRSQFGVTITSGIRSLGLDAAITIMHTVATFNSFTEDNDPHGEHDFGAFTHDDNRCFWKIDYYAPDMQHGSDDPTDPKQTVRVLTIMLAEEY